ncbi:MAG: hypothetical protein OEW64_10370 [Gammaproteobacteria bacterium]|nr:hypothetical protein [Gammaproteobacteria bacterium]MDH5304486.1 hypothetical protein [Gammaproteobacteria bacterium]MDH5321971.1 hypothetical protein [Gammaproteobacteria bacterium]
MVDYLDNKPSTNFWIIGGAALVWNLIGLVFYVGQVTMSPEALAKMTETQQEFFVSTPAWATAAFAIAVNAGVLGSLFLLLRKSWAIPMFVLSLLAIIVQDVDAFLLRDAFGVLGVSGVIIPSMVFVIAIALLLYARATKTKHWLS